MKLHAATAAPREQSRVLEQAVARAGEVIVGKEQQIRLALCCLLANGHLLIEDVPGVGKTTLAHVLARVLGLEFQRIQFTSDLLPADIIGVSIYENETRQFKFQRGPIFASVVLADEINRATPKAQSALLEAMEERQVTSDGVTHPLPEPFFVIATQNPRHQVGTFPLPESQLDRFLIRIEMGYPDRAAERELLEGGDRRVLLRTLEPAIDGATLRHLRQVVNDQRCAPALLDYIQDLLEATRRAPQLNTGLSPRAGLAIRQAARAWALLRGRDAVMPEDVQAVLPGVVGHRLQADSEQADATPAHRVRQLIEAVPVP